MSILRRLGTSLAVLFFPAFCVLAQDGPAARKPGGNESFETVQNEFLSARNAYIKDLQAASMRPGRMVRRKTLSSTRFRRDSFSHRASS